MACSLRSFSSVGIDVTGGFNAGSRGTTGVKQAMPDGAGGFVNTTAGLDLYGI